MPQHWYIKLSDRITGPVLIGELRQHAAEGRLIPDAWVSLDRQRWIRASQVEGLDFPASGQNNPSSTVTPSADQSTGDDLATARGPANSEAGSDVGFPVAAEETVIAKRTALPEKVSAKIGELVASAKGVTAKASAYARSEEANARVERILSDAKEASSRAKEHASKATRRVKETAVATIPFWRKLLREIRETVVATARQTARLVRYGYGIARMPVLRRSARDAQLNLGHCMYESGLGDADIQLQITVLDDRIKSIESAKGSTRPLESERRGLKIRLASSALTQEALSGRYSSEHHQALNSHMANQAHLLYLGNARAGLIPATLVEWRRVVFGYGTVGCLIFLSWVLVSSTTYPTKNQTVSLHTDGPAVARNQQKTNGTALDAKSYDGNTKFSAVDTIAIPPSSPADLTTKNGSPNAQSQMGVRSGDDGGDVTAQVFGKGLLARVTPPSIFGFRMGISPEEMNLAIKSKGGKQIAETMPYSMTKRVGVERPLEREIRIFQSNTKDIPDLDIPKGFDLITFVFAGGQLYKITLHSKYYWSDASPRTLSAFGLPRNISKQEAEEALRKAGSNLELHDKTTKKAFVDWMDIRAEPGVTLSEFRRISEAAWKKNYLLDLAFVPGSAYERAGIVRTPNFYINQSNRKGGLTTIKEVGNLTVVLDDSGWGLEAGDAAEGIYKRELHSHWLWTEFVEKYGTAYLVWKSEAARKETPPGNRGRLPDIPVPQPNKPSEPAKEITNTLGMQLRLIPAGEFMMGSPDLDKDADGDEKPSHRVRITKAFYLGATEVTQGQYKQIVQNPSHFKWSDDLPVEMVSWNDAVWFCNKLSEREKLEPYYEIGSDKVMINGGPGYRLPTEAEWEYACRAGTTTRYSFGDDGRRLDEYAWVGENQTHSVGQKRANAFGLHDMHGNVWEWCWDQCDHRYNPRVIRGGSWNDDARHARSAARGGPAPDNRLNYLGFRVARDHSSH